MNRRAFLHYSSFAAVGLIVSRRLLAESAPSPSAPAATAPAAAPRPPPPTAFKLLRRDVGIFTGRGGTIGWLAAKDGLAVVDTQFPDTAAICLDGLPGRNGRLLDAVINTHHHADHTSGNPVFKAATRMLVAHENVPKLQLAAAQQAEREQKGRAAPRIDQLVFADTTFKDVWRREIGDEIVSANYEGPAHTSGDVQIHFEKANVVHMGDLMFNRIYPVIRRTDGASIRGWIKILEDAARSYPSDAIFVFGHGNPKFGVTGTREDLLVFRDYWSAVLEHVQKQIAAGKTKAEVVTLANLPGFDDFHQPVPNRLGSNLTAAYEELTAE